MACFVPFNNRNLDISFFVFRPTVVLVEELVDALKDFSACTETLGCVNSSIFRSIHGNLIIWYAAWMKRSRENKEMLISSLLQMLKSLSNKGVLVEYRFVDAYAGESKEGSCVAKFYTGDVICLNVATSTAGDLNDVSYANLAIFKDRFWKMEGAVSGVCLKLQDMPAVSCLYVWKSLQHCYSWILNADHRKTMVPYLDRFKLDIKYDIFRVVYVSTEAALSWHSNSTSPALTLASEGESKEQRQVMQI
ncbi:hypothetical protein CUMW_009310 [Citrus unshiu]|nr:hypothetical protein CUMW_009310 [Citrus unshiu]